MKMDPLETCTADPSQFVRDWIRQISSSDNKLLDKLQLDFDSLEENLFDNYTWGCGYQENIKKIKIPQIVDDEEFPENCVSGSISFEDGTIFNGIFKEDLSYRHGKLFVNANSDRGLEGTWIEGLLEGRATTDNEYGGYELAFYKCGVRHGVVVEFGPNRSKDFMKCCFYKNGEPFGLCLKAMIGGGFIVGKMYEDKISDNKAGIVLPGFKAAMVGVVVEDTFVRGKEVEVVGVRLENGIPTPILSQPKSSTVYKRDVSNSKTIGKWPLLLDPWERRRVEARTSNVSGAGEGLFAKRDIETEELVALYNGTRTAPSLAEDWSDYRVHLNSDLDIDIPDDMRDLENYSATLSHKANHSFEPNCRWSRIDHPRFGLICSITAMRRIKEGEEVTVNYRLPLHLAPLWYRECYQEYQRRKSRDRTVSRSLIENILGEIIDDLILEDNEENALKYEQTQYDDEENIEDRRQFQEQRMI